MTYPAYEQYKDSGIPWLGQVPEGWKLKRLKFSTHLINEKYDYADINVPYMGLEHIQPWTGKRIPDNASTSEGVVCRFTRNDVLFGKLRPYLAKVYLALEDGCASTEALVMRPKSETDPSYLKYFMLMPEFINAVDASTYGAKMPRANWEFIGNQLITLPKIEEQKAIAAFLDRKTAEIDALIGKKEALLGLLEEKRTATITHAVTKGLNPAAPLKPSGIPWLGDIPEHWDIKRLKQLLSEQLKYGANEAAEHEDKTQPRYIRITDVKDDGSLRPETFKSLDEEIAAPYILDDGDILLARSGATVGKSFIYRPSWGRAAYAGYLIRARIDLKYAYPDFVFRFLNSGAYWSWLNSIFIQATIQNVSAEKYAYLWMAIPPISEQREIAAYLDMKTAEIDAAKNKITAAIERLREYRTALITHAVTGKIKVV
ncbi:MAG: restriction endonuclease subunit S [Alphaproteobacteria bacterium]